MEALRLVMMGTGTFAEPTLEALLQGSDPVVGVFTQPDRDTGNRRGSTRQVGRGMKEIAQEANIPVFQPEKINAPEGVTLLKDLKADLLVVAAYGQILSNEVLATARWGGINVHASLLPKYRGAAPIAWAIYHGEAESGVTIIRMSTTLDAGDMLDQQAVSILPEETSGELEARLAVIGARMALDTIAQMKHGPITGKKQDPALVTKAPKLKKEMGLIDWSRSPKQVQNQIRAMFPWPTSYTFFQRPGKEPIRLLIQRTGEIGTRSTDVPNGTLLPGNKLHVATGEHGWIEVLELQPAGKKKMTAEEFLRGYPVQSGYRFGSEQPV